MTADTTLGIVDEWRAKLAEPCVCGHVRGRHVWQPASWTGLPDFWTGCLEDVGTAYICECEQYRTTEGRDG